MATKRELVKRCGELGVSLTDDGNILSAAAPAGKVFAGLDVGVVSVWHKDYTRPEAYEALLADMAGGVEDGDPETF